MQFGRTLIAAALLASFAALPSPSFAADIPAYIKNAIDAPGRPREDKARDAYMKPAEVIEYVGIKPGDRVVDFAPWEGYWTRILSKVVGPQGKVYSYVPLRNLERSPRAGETSPAEAVLAIQSNPDYKNVTVIMQGPPWVWFTAPEPVDVVMTTTNYHDLRNKNWGPMDPVAFDAAVLKALKPGGTYYVSDNATVQGQGFKQTETLHRSDKGAVHAEIYSVGFQFADESDILAMPGDDHTKSAMDESMAGKIDRFALRFKKPLSASNPAANQSRARMAAYFDKTFILGSPQKWNRTIWYHPDGSYQEYGKNDMQAGTYYFNADGWICLLHEFPLNQRGFTTCHPFEPGHKVGEYWLEWSPQDHDGPGSPVGVTAGYLLPDGAPGAPPRPGAQP